MADLLTNGKGEAVTLEQRLADIATRYGIESKQYRDAKKLNVDITEVLNNLGLADSQYLEGRWQF